MQFAKKMVLMPQDVARVLNMTSQDKTQSRLSHLDEDMKVTLLPRNHQLRSLSFTDKLPEVFKE